MDSAGRGALVIEDDADIRELIVHSLGMQGFSVRSAASGRAGLALLQDHQPDLVTLDLGLPDLDGVEVCRRIRQQSDAYIVMISARTDEIDRLIGLETGADDYLTKPFSPRELQARVNAMFRRPRAAVADGAGVLGERVAPAPASGSAAVGSEASASDASAHDDGRGAVTLGRVVVDTESRTATVDGTEVELTRTEFDLLATLVEAPRRVWGRDVLLRSLWGEGWSGEERLVEVHIGNLRRKLGRAARSAPPLPFIRTVRGVGYRMEDPAQLETPAK
jgi:DNA-binding response OmpR family regulator